MSKKKAYEVLYNDKKIVVFASCEENAYWKILNANGIFYSKKLEDDIILNNKMEINRI